MTKHTTRAFLSRMRFERRQKIDLLRQRLRDLDREPVMSADQLAEAHKKRAFLQAEIAQFQKELNELARGSKAQKLGGWGHA